jgi:hypothetical protein
MFVPPGYFSRAHVSLGVFIAVLIAGIAIVGTDASDTEMQIVGGTAFIVMMVTLAVLLSRLDRQQGRGR